MDNREWTPEEVQGYLDRIMLYAWFMDKHLPASLFKSEGSKKCKFVRLDVYSSKDEPEDPTHWRVGMGIYGLGYFEVATRGRGWLGAASFYVQQACEVLVQAGKFSKRTGGYVANDGTTVAAVHYRTKRVPYDRCAIAYIRDYQEWRPVRPAFDLGAIVTLQDGRVAEVIGYEQYCQFDITTYWEARAHDIPVNDIPAVWKYDRYYRVRPLSGGRTFRVQPYQVRS